MANMIDPIPLRKGEADTWNYLSDNLPKQYIVYNTRSIFSWEFDFCILSPQQGLFILEVKGWNPEYILSVLNSEQIQLVDEEKPSRSPRSQARGYCFDLVKLFNKTKGFNPLVLDMVCYPYISKEQYYEKRLDVVSAENETIFQEDLNDKTLLLKKLNARFAEGQKIKHDYMDAKLFARIRHHFEPGYDLKEDLEILNPGYSRLRVLLGAQHDTEINAFTDEYFKGIKEIVFTDDRKVFNSLIAEIKNRYNARNIHPDRGAISLGKDESDQIEEKEHYSIFNFDIYYVSDLNQITMTEITIEEGQTTAEQQTILEKLADATSFNYQQFKVEHAPTDKNIKVSAGAGTGKTYSMVSRVAYLCNRVIDPVVNIADDILMITFTNDAADNMKVRLKKMFMNYFLLTANQKYLRYIEDTTQMQVSTIHKFAISLLRKTCFHLGLGRDFQVRSETFERRQLYKQYLDEYLARKTMADSDFHNRISIPVYELLDILLDFSGQLYNKSVDIKDLEPDDYGNVSKQFEFFTEMIDEVIIPAERDYYSFLIDSNSIDLRQCMILLDRLVSSKAIRKQDFTYKYVFIDEFQDTDDSQIDSVQGLYDLMDGGSKLFVVGDLKQSIYRFRGATLSAFRKIQHGLSGWYEYILNINYRSDYRMLEKFDQVFDRMGEANFLPYKKTDDSLKSRILKEYEDSELLKCVSVNGKDEKVFYDTFFQELENQLNLLKALQFKKDLSAEEKTIAILVRTNKEITRIVSKGKEYGYKIITSEGGDLFRQQSTIDLYKLVQALCAPTDVSCLLNLLRSNYVGLKLDYASLMGLESEQKVQVLTEILDEYFMMCMGKKWHRIISAFQSEPVLIVLREIYEATQPWNQYDINEDFRISYRQNYECLLEDIIQQYTRDFLTLNMIYKHLTINITTFQDKDSRGTAKTDGDIRIVCMTVHKSKGLEYGTVILPYTAWQINKPTSSKLATSYTDGKLGFSVVIGKAVIQNDYFDEEEEIRETAKEESRILYVAMTRAIRNCVWFKDLDQQKSMSWGELLEVAA